jgi:hypothetical protein
MPSEKPMTDNDCRELANAILRAIREAAADSYQALNTLAMAMGAVIGRDYEYEEIAELGEHLGRQIARMAQEQASPTH